MAAVASRSRGCRWYLLIAATFVALALQIVHLDLSSPQSEVPPKAVTIVPRPVFVVTETTFREGDAARTRTWERCLPGARVRMLEYEDMRSQLLDSGDAGQLLAQRFDEVSDPRLQLELFAWVQLFRFGGIVSHASVECDVLATNMAPNATRGPEPQSIAIRGSVTPRNSNFVVAAAVRGDPACFERLLCLLNHRGNCSEHVQRTFVSDGAFATVELPTQISEAVVYFNPQRMREPDNVKSSREATIAGSRSSDIPAGVNCPLNYSAGAENAERGTKTPDSERFLHLVALRTPASLAPRSALRIPRKIVQTARLPAVPLGMHAAIRSVIELNPTWTHHYYDDERARAYILEHMGLEHAQTFDSLIPGAFKSDVFRHIWLLVEGGVYIDADEVLLKPLDELLLPTDEFVSAEDDGHGILYNAFIATIPQHPIMRQLVDDVFNMTSRRLYTSGKGYTTGMLAPLDLTGPGAFGRAFEAVMGTKPRRYQTYGDGSVRLFSHTKVHPSCSVSLVDNGTEPFVHTRYPGFRREMVWYNEAQPSYGILWRARRVYRKPLEGYDRLPPTLPRDVTAIWRECPLRLRNERRWTTLHRSLQDLAPRGTVTVDAISDDFGSTLPPPCQHETNVACPIPRIIVQYVETPEISPVVRDAMLSVKRLNPHYAHRVVTKRAAERWINAHPCGASAKWGKTRSAAERSKAFMHFFLTFHGGFAVDASTFAFQSFDRAVNSSVACLTVSSPRTASVIGSVATMRCGNGSAPIPIPRRGVYVNWAVKTNHLCHLHPVSDGREIALYVIDDF